jgi:hypothetical protein
MEHTPNASDLRVNLGTGTPQHKKASDYVYQVATVAVVLLLLLTATV